MSALLAGLLLGAAAAAVLGAGALKGRRGYRKARATARRWGRTRLVITQAPRTRRRRRRRR